eukprot:1161263-Pelagomonas_calceolata.AAC.39
MDNNNITNTTLLYFCTSRPAIKVTLCLPTYQAVKQPIGKIASKVPSCPPMVMRACTHQGHIISSHIEGQNMPTYMLMRARTHQGQNMPTYMLMRAHTHKGGTEKIRPGEKYKLLTLLSQVYATSVECQSRAQKANHEHKEKRQLHPTTLTTVNRAGPVEMLRRRAWAWATLPSATEPKWMWAGLRANWRPALPLARSSEPL